MVKIKDFTLASKNLKGHVPPSPTELPPMCAGNCYIKKTSIHFQNLTFSLNTLEVEIEVMPALSPMTIFRLRPTFTSSITKTNVSNSWANVEYAYLKPVETNACDIRTK